MATQTENAILNLVINGEQAMATYKELNAARAQQLSLVKSLKETDPGYKEQLAKLQQITEVEKARRAEIFKTTEAQKGFFQSFKDGFSEMAGNITAGTLVYKGVSAILGTLKDLWNGSEVAYQEAVKGQAQLDAALKSTQGVAGETKKSLNDMAGSLMDITGIDDDVISKGEAMLLTFTNIRGKIYEQALPAIVDMTSALNQGNVNMENIQATSIQVGKALNDPIKGMTALAKVGVTFNDQQKEQIKTLVESNRMQEAQAIILKELQKEFGGTAKIIADTDVGAMQKMQTRIGNIQENIGGLITTVKGGFAKAFDPFLSWVEKATSTNLPEKLHEEQDELNGLVGAIVSCNDNQQVRNQLIAELQAKYPDFLGNINAENAANDLLLRRLQGVNDQYREKIFIAANEDKLKDIQERKTNAIKEEADARERVAKASGLSATELAKLTDAQVKNLAKKVGDKKASNDLTSLQQTGGGGFFANLLDVNAAQEDIDKIVNGRKRIDEIGKEETDLMSANAVYEQKLKDIKIKGIDEEIAKLTQKMKVEKDAGKASNDQRELDNLARQKNQLLGIIETPKSGPSAATQSAAAKKAEEFKKQLADVQSQYLQLSEAAQKGTVDGLDAQLKVIDDKYQKVVDKLAKLAADPRVSAILKKEFGADILNITKSGGLRDQAKAAATDEYNKKLAAEQKRDQEAEFKAGSGRVDNIYDQAQANLDKEQNNDLNGLTGDPATIEAQRFNIQQIYAQKSYELEQQHLEDMKSIYQVYGKDTGELDKKIAENTIKENERAAKQKLADEKKYTEAKKTIQDMQLDNMDQGAKVLLSILDKNSSYYKAALVVEQSVAAARVIINTEASIAAFAAANASIPLVGAGLISAYTIAARISEGISLTAIAAQTISGLKGEGNTYADGGILPTGPTHASGGLNLVGPYGKIYGQIEGGEPVLSRQTYANNKGVIDALLNSGGAQLNYERVMQATTDREARRSISTATAVPKSGSASTTAQNTITQSMGDYAARLSRMEAMLEKQLQINEKPIVLSRRAMEKDDAQVVEIRNRANPK